MTKDDAINILTTAWYNRDFSFTVLGCFGKDVVEVSGDNVIFNLMVRGGELDLNFPQTFNSLGKKIDNLTLAKIEVPEINL